MPSLVTDEIVDEFVVSARTDELPARLHERFGDLVDRIAINPPAGVEDATWSELLADVRRSGAH